LIIVSVEVVHGDTEESDAQAEVHQTQHDIEVGIDTISENKEWIINDLSLTLWNLDRHFF
jgi:hypothetical protein